MLYFRTDALLYSEISLRFAPVEQVLSSEIMHSDWVKQPSKLQCFVAVLYNYITRKSVYENIPSAPLRVSHRLGQRHSG